MSGPVKFDEKIEKRQTFQIPVGYPIHTTVLKRSYDDQQAMTFSRVDLKRSWSIDLTCSVISQKVEKFCMSRPVKFDEKSENIVKHC